MVDGTSSSKQRPTGGDAQCAAIAKGLLELRRLFVDDPLGTRALEATTNRDSAGQLTRLERLCESLSQYATRTYDLTYVGLMGHFSTGKSSTINSLLNLDGTENAREVGLNPTDRVITLLTHPRNIPRLQGIVREGSVVIRAIGLPHPLLERTVVADTPGSGDPQVFNEIIRDFLPVCDLLLYFVSAANPVDSADIPLLRKKHESLPFIPLRFVVTRADEFRKVHAEPLSLDNYDERAFETFAAQLEDRLRLILPGTTRTPSDFIAIDNRAAFQIDLLRGWISEATCPPGRDLATALHSHKVEYFRVSARRVRTFVVEFLKSKEATVAKFVQTCKKNIQRFQTRVQISNNEMTERWRRARDELGTQYRDAKERATDTVQPLDAKPTFWGHPDAGVWLGETREMVARHAERASTEISHDIERRWARALRSWSDGTVAALTAERLRSEREASALIGDPTADEQDAVTSPAVPLALQERLAESTRFAIRAVQARNDALLRATRTLLGRTQAGFPLSQFDVVVDDAVASLKGDIAAYFEVVQVYHVAVMSMQVRDSISKLGLGAKLDELSADLPTDLKEQAQDVAVERMFAARTQYSDQFKATCERLTSAGRAVAEQLQQATPAVLAPERSLGDGVWDADVSVARAVIADADGAFRARAAQVAGAVRGEVKIALEAMDLRLLDAARTRRRTILKFTGSLVGAAMLVYCVLAYLDVIGVGTVLGQVLLGIAVNFIAALVFAAIGARVWRLAPRQNQIIVDYANELRATVRKMMEEAAPGLSMPGATRLEIRRALGSGWQESVQKYHQDVIDPQVRGVNSVLFELTERLRGIALEYTAALDQLHQQYAGFFADPVANQQILADVAGNFKNVAIQPSFGVLEETHIDLSQVLKSAGDVEF